MTGDQRSFASEAAGHLLARLAGLGLRHVVVAPGSRSQALALAAVGLERTGDLRLHVRIDERVAGFTASGLAIETGRPVAVIVTSGTAVAELHPAVLEAHHAGVPLLLLTADRPVELRGVGANQATVQPGIFATAVRTVVDVPAPESDDDVAAATDLADRVWATAVLHRQPVQVNLAYREPLSSPLDVVRPVRPETVVATPEPHAVELHPGPRTVVIAGDRAGERAEQFARDLDVPLLAEVSSGARFGPQLVIAYRRLLDDAAFGARVQRAVVFGHPTLSRQVPRLLARADVETVLVGPPGGEWFDPTGGRARRVGDVTASGRDPDGSWRAQWVEASAPTTSAAPAGISRTDLVRAVWNATGPDDRLVLGASRLVREADQVVPGRRIRVISNRGLAGIDGTVATASGVALGLADGGGTGITRVLLGDLSLLHDVGALLQAPDETGPRLQVIVGDDGGGSLFDSLEVASTADAAAFDRVVRTPRPVDWTALAAAFGWRHVRVTTAAELERVLAEVTADRVLIEVPLPRE